MATPERHAVLTIEDVPELPNGTATIFEVATPTHHDVYKATVDCHGYVRLLDDRRTFPPAEYEVLIE